jgi:hypothetical protein
MYVIHPTEEHNLICFENRVLRTMLECNLVFLASWGGMRLSPLGTWTTIRPLYQPRMIDDDECGAVSGM